MPHRPPPHWDLKFREQGREGRARAGVFRTPHGEVRTPAFMPVGTRAALRALTNAQVHEIGPELLLANAYHLHLRPGEDLVRDLGGLHGFTGWQRPCLTDSGGFQVFSLQHRVRVDEAGATLRSHLDGTPIRLGPREAMRIQESLGADLVMALDHCLPYPASHRELEAAVERTTRWAEACARARTRDDQALFGIVQGGTVAALRERSARQLGALDLPGYAVGGLAVGEGPDRMREALEATMPFLPQDRPRYLMGVGPPLDLLDAIALGVDLFDCVLPTRLGRRGWLMTPDGTVRIASRRYARDERPLQEDCRCETCKTHSRAYLRHLFQVGEHGAVTLGSLHNLTFIVDLVREARDRIREGTFQAFRAAFDERWQRGEEAWRREHAADPHGAERSRLAREAWDARQRASESESD